MSEGISAEVLAEAKSDGWAEKEQWRGPPELWVNADEFVRRKHTVLPLLRKANEKVTGELAATREELKALRENMTEFVKYQQEQTLAKLADQRRVLMAQKREAADSGDDAAVVRIEEQLDENAEAKAALKAKPVETVEVKPAPEPADLTMWRAANPWFGTDDVKTGLAMGLAREAAKQGLTGKPYFDHIDKGIKKIYAPEPPAGAETCSAVRIFRRFAAPAAALP